MNNDSGMQSFLKLKLLEHILLKSNANGNLDLIEVQFLTMYIHFGIAVTTFVNVMATLCQFLKFVSPLESYDFG